MPRACPQADRSFTKATADGTAEDVWFKVISSMHQAYQLDVPAEIGAAPGISGGVLDGDSLHQAWCAIRTGH